jgi:probable rRNA maturation factor
MSAARRPKTSTTRSACRIDVIVDESNAAAWSRAVPRIEAQVRRAARAALRHIKPARGRQQMTVRLSGDRDVRRLNHDFRGKDKPTNVLSFPSGDTVGPRGAPLLLGDIVIAYGTVAREASAQGKTVRDHLLHRSCTVCCTCSAMTTCGRMEKLETALLAELGIADPYVLERRRA